MTTYKIYLTLPNEPLAPSGTILLPKRGPREATRVAEARRKVQEEAQEILQDLRSTGMAKHLFEWPKHGLWNIAYV